MSGHRSSSRHKPLAVRPTLQLGSSETSRATAFSPRVREERAFSADSVEEGEDIKNDHFMIQRAIG